MPFGAKVVALAGPEKWEVREGRSGFWVMLRFGKKEGYAFSGYLTQINVPPFQADPVNLCYNLQWFETVALANADSLVYKGHTQWNVFNFGTFDAGELTNVAY